MDNSLCVMKKLSSILFGYYDRIPSDSYDIYNFTDMYIVVYLLTRTKGVLCIEITSGYKLISKT